MAASVRATFLHHTTAEPVVVDLPVCPTCGRTGPTCTTARMHPARRALIAPLIGSPGPTEPIALQPTLGDCLTEPPTTAETR